MHEELRKAQDRLFWRVGILLLLVSIAGVVLAFTNFIIPDNPLQQYKWLVVIYFISMASMMWQAYHKKKKQDKYQEYLDNKKDTPGKKMK